jgi:tetratricopeptide (TPR) repeat protein
LIVYFPSLSNGIKVWDDNEYLNNPYVKNLSPAGIVQIFSVYFAGNYHPLTLISLGMDRLMGGNNPFMFHFTNLLLHLANAFLVFVLVKRLTRNKELALLTFILFGVHTLHVESVAWVAERKDVLYSFFFLLSLILYSTYASGRKTLYYGLSLLFFLLSLLAKGQAVVLAVLLPLIDYVQGRRWLSIKVLSEKAPFLILSLIFGWVAFRAQGSANYIHLAYFSLPERVAFASYGLAQYMIKSILPIGLSAYYPFPARLANGSIPSLYWFCIITLPLFFTGFYFLAKRSKIYAFGLGMFFLCLLPLLQLIPVGGAIMADRYFYMPSVGLMLCFAFGLMEIRKNKSIRYVLVILFVLVLSVLSFSRCKVWKDNLTLWDDVVSKQDHFQVGYYNRGISYYGMKQWDKAIADYTKAIELDPQYTDAYYNRGVSWDNAGEWEKAIADYSKAIELDPGYSKAYDNRGVICGKIGKLDMAIADCSKAIETDPKSAEAYDNRGLAYSYRGEWDKAIADYTRATELETNFTQAYDNRGLAYLNLRRFDEALADISNAIRIDPGNAKAYSDRGFTYNLLRQYDKAMEDYSKAIEIDPKFTDAYSNRGIAFINLGQWDKAIADFSSVIEIDPRNATAYYNRGFAYSNLGQWDEAVSDFTQTIEINPNFTSAYQNREIAYRKLLSHPANPALRRPAH